MRGTCAEGNSTRKLQARAASYGLAMRVQAKMPEAVDTVSESAEMQKLYGRDDPVSEDIGKKPLAHPATGQGAKGLHAPSG